MAPTTRTFQVLRTMLRQTSLSDCASMVRNNSSFKARFLRKQTTRWQSTQAEAKLTGSWFKSLLDSPVGIKTVHFWAPAMKWSIVIAGISDLFRPAEKLSVTQNFALACSGLIWTRWCFVIKPKNMLLAAVNFFTGCVGLAQLTRITIHESATKTERAATINNGETVA